MANTDTNTDGGDSKRAISKRDWINAAGDRVPTGSPDVAGIRYTYLANGESVEFKFADSQQLTYQFAAMGGVTKLGNVVNSIVNADDYDGSNPMEYVKDWLADAIAGQWREPGEGTRGPKYDNAILADVLATMAAAKGKSTTAPEYLAKLDDKKFRAQILAYAEVKAAYAQEAEKRGVTPRGPAKDIGDVL